MPDSELQALFEMLVREYSESLFRFSFRSLNNWHDAEDHVHDVFEKAWSKLDQLNDRRAAKSWLFTICRNRLATRITRKSKKIQGGDEERIHEIESADNQLENSDWIQFAAQQLDPKMLEVVLLVEMEQFTVTEAAAILSIPRGTVLSRLHRGKTKMKQIMENEQAGVSPCESETKLAEGS